MHAKLLQLCLTLRDPMDCSPQGPLSMRFSRQEYCSGLPCPPPEDFSQPGIESSSLMSHEFVSEFFTSSTSWKAQNLPE